MVMYLRLYGKRKLEGVVKGVFLVTVKRLRMYAVKMATEVKDRNLKSSPDRTVPGESRSW